MQQFMLRLVRNAGICGILFCLTAQANPLDKLEEFAVKQFPKRKPPVEAVVPESPAPAFNPEKFIESPGEDSIGPAEKLDAFNEKYGNTPEESSGDSEQKGDKEEGDIPSSDLVVDEEESTAEAEPKIEPSKDWRYPILFTPEALNSGGYIFNADEHQFFIKGQFQFGQYKFFRNYFQSFENFLIFKPYLGVGAKGSLSDGVKVKFWIETFNAIKLSKYSGAGFKVILETKSLDTHDDNFHGFLQAFLFRNFSKRQRWLTAYIGFTSAQMPISLSHSFKDYMMRAKELLSQKEGFLVGIYYNPNIIKTLSYSVETNAQNFVSFSVFLGLD